MSSKRKAGCGEGASLTDPRWRRPNQEEHNLFWPEEMLPSPSTQPSFLLNRPCNLPCDLPAHEASWTHPAPRRFLPCPHPRGPSFSSHASTPLRKIESHCQGEEREKVAEAATNRPAQHTQPSPLGHHHLGGEMAGSPPQQGMTTLPCSQQLLRCGHLCHDLPTSTHWPI